MSSLVSLFSLLLLLSTLSTISATLTKSYLSSNPRISPPRQFPFFSYSRHPSSLPPFNPLHGVENVLIHRGLLEYPIPGILDVQARDDDGAGSNFTRMYSDRILWVGSGVHVGGNKRTSAAVKGRGWGDGLERMSKGGDEDGNGGDDEEGGGGDWSGHDKWGGGRSGNGNDGSGDSGRNDDNGNGYSHGKSAGYSKTGGRKGYGHDNEDGEASSSRGSSYNDNSPPSGSKWDDSGNDHESGEGRFKSGKYSGSSYNGGGGKGSGAGNRGEDDGQWLKGTNGDSGKYSGNDEHSNDSNNDDENGTNNGDDSSYNTDDYSSQSANDDSDSLKPPSPANSPSSYSGGGAHRLAQSQYSNPSRSDCARLMQFFKAMSSSSSWTRDDGWADDDDTNCCGWFGVTCDAQQRVTGLDLGGNGLKGGLGDTLFAVNALVRIDISDNPITSLQDRFASLPKLTHFSASSCNLTGTIPQTLLSSPSIINIDLSNNQLTGPVQLSSSSVYTLSLQNNQLSSISIQDTISTSGLGKVDIGFNAFTGNLPDLSGSTNLSVFDASSNNFTGPIFDLSHLTNLTRFDVRSNGLTGSFPTFTAQSSLKSLYLSSNSFSGPFPAGPAPPTLQSCYVSPSNSPSPCPSPQDLSDPSSWSAKCHLTCPKAGNPIDRSSKFSHPNAQGKAGAGIPVSPLPGESLGGGGTGIQAQGVVGGTTLPPQNPIPVAGGVQWGQQPVPGRDQGFTPPTPIARVRGKAAIGDSGLMGDINGATRLSTGWVMASLPVLPIMMALIWV